MDRFFLRLSLGYPTESEESLILQNLGSRTPYEIVETVASPEMLRTLRKETASVHVSEALRDYIVALVGKTRTHASIKLGASPRASRSLYQGAKTWAAMQGRSYAIPEDVQAIFLSIMNHRVTLTGDARLRKLTPEAVLTEIMDKTDVPPSKKELFHA